MDHDQKRKNVNHTLYEWALNSPILQKAFGTNYKKDINDLLHNFFFDDHEKIKAKLATELYKKLWGSRCQFGPLPPFELLQEFENKRVYYKDYRDHTTHSLFTCLLGLYIYENNSTIKKACSEFIAKNFSTKKKEEEQEEMFVSLWLLSSLYHDIGYLVENNKIETDSNILDSFTKEINKLLKNPLASTPSFAAEFSRNEEDSFINKYSIYTRKLNSVNDITKISVDKKEIDSFTFLQNASDCSYLTTGNINGVKNYYDLAQKSKSTIRDDKFRDHGISSALLLLYCWYSFRQYIQDICSNEGSDISCFRRISSLKEHLNGSFKDIITFAAQAISLHNINKTIWDERDTLNNDLTLRKFCIVLQKNENAMPLAFLLRLCDELQVWDRPRFRPLHDEDEYILSKDINIIVSNNGIFLQYLKDE